MSETIRRFIGRDGIPIAISLLLVVGCLLLGFLLAEDVFGSPALGALVAALVFAAGVIYLLARYWRDRPAIQPPPDWETQERFDALAQGLIDRMAGPWKLVGTSLGIFAAIGLTFFGFNVYELRKEVGVVSPAVELG